MSRFIAPSILAADFGNLADSIDQVNKSKAEWVHCDIMDGMFVPNISFGFPVLDFVNKLSDKQLDIHLMIVEPEKYVERFCAFNTKFLTIHYEACNHLHSTIQQIKNQGCGAGVSLNPHTPVSLLKDVIQDVDLVLIMSVNPGFGGQKFIEHSCVKIEELKNLIVQTNSNTLIEVDGGVDQSNAARIFASGADILVAGSAIFGKENPTHAIDQMLNAQ